MCDVTSRLTWSHTVHRISTLIVIRNTGDVGSKVRWRAVHALDVQTQGVAEVGGDRTGTGFIPQDWSWFMYEGQYLCMKLL